MQLAGSREGGWVYTKQDPRVQNGNPGSILAQCAEHLLGQWQSTVARPLAFMDVN